LGGGAFFCACESVSLLRLKYHGITDVFVLTAAAWATVHLQIQSYSK